MPTNSPSKFRRGALAYTQNGRRYTVEEITDGTVYCIGDNDAETEFSESALLTEAEWGARNDKRSGNVYTQLRQSPLYAKSSARFDPGAAAALLTRIEKLTPGILDFTAFTTASRILSDAGEAAQIPGLSVTKCRAVFEEAKPEIRAGLLAALLSTQPELLVNATRLGDNLMRALIEKGMAAHTDEFDEFSDRPRK